MSSEDTPNERMNATGADKGGLVAGGLSKRLTLLAEFLKLQHEFADKINLHDDRMLIWIVGLSGGTIALFLQILPSEVVDRSPLLVLVGMPPLFYAAFAAVMGRIHMAKLLQRDRECFVGRFEEIRGVERDPGMSDEEIIARLLKQSFSEPSVRLVEKEKDLKSLMPKVNYWLNRSQEALAIGIVWVFLLTMFAFLFTGDMPVLLRFRPPG